MDEDFEMTEEEEAQFTKMAQEKLQKFDGDKTQMDSKSQEETDKNVSIMIICIYIINIVFQVPDPIPSPSSSNQDADMVTEVKYN